MRQSFIEAAVNPVFYANTVLALQISQDSDGGRQNRDDVKTLMALTHKQIP